MSSIYGLYNVIFSLIVPWHLMFIWSTATVKVVTLWMVKKISESVCCLLLSSLCSCSVCPHLSLHSVPVKHQFFIRTTGFIWTLFSVSLQTTGFLTQWIALLEYTELNCTLSLCSYPTVLILDMPFFNWISKRIFNMYLH